MPISQKPNITYLVQKGVLEIPCVGLSSFTNNATTYHLLSRDNPVGLCHIIEYQKTILKTCSNLSIEIKSRISLSNILHVP